jgi:hypothetical protein
MEPESLGADGTKLDVVLKPPEPENISIRVDSKLRLNAASGARLDLHSIGLTARAHRSCSLSLQRFNQTGDIG